MFGFFKKKKSKIQQLIDERGYEAAVAIAAGSVIERIPNRAAAYEFILQELDGASMGNEQSREAAANSGIPANDYKDALSKVAPVLDAAHDHITNYTIQLAAGPELMSRFRVDIGVEIMRIFEFGRFSPAFGSSRPAAGDVEDHRGENFVAAPGSFTVTDRDTGDVLHASIKDGMFHGAIVIKSAGLSAGLAPWPVGSNPFQDDLNFSGSGNGPAGPWSFSVTPTIPFSEILEMARDETPPAQAGTQHGAGDVARIKSGAARIVARLARDQGATVSEQDMRSLVQNVAANIGERDIGLAGEQVLAMASLTSITAYSIDQGDIDMANAYFASVMAGFEQLKVEWDALSPYQANALQTIIREFSSVKEELVAANAK